MKVANEALKKKYRDKGVGFQISELVRLLTDS